MFKNSTSKKNKQKQSSEGRSEFLSLLLFFLKIALILVFFYLLSLLQDWYLFHRGSDYFYTKAVVLRTGYIGRLYKPNKYSIEIKYMLDNVEHIDYLPVSNEETWLISAGDTIDIVLNTRYNQVKRSFRQKGDLFDKTPINKEKYGSMINPKNRPNNLNVD
jgi:hypothetical protein